MLYIYLRLNVDNKHFFVVVCIAKALLAQRPALREEEKICVDQTTSTMSFSVRDSVLIQGEKGVFANEDVEKGEVILYMVTPKVGGADASDGCKTQTGYYIDEVSEDMVIWPDIYFDGDPEGVDELADIGCMVNEPPPGCAQNCIMMHNPLLYKEEIEKNMQEGGKCTLIGGYVITVKDMNKDEELFSYYGSRYPRTYKIGTSVEENAAWVEAGYDALDDFFDEQCSDTSGSLEEEEEGDVDSQ